MQGVETTIGVTRDSDIWFVFLVSNMVRLNVTGKSNVMCNGIAIPFFASGVIYNLLKTWHHNHVSVRVKHCSTRGALATITEKAVV